MPRPTNDQLKAWGLDGATSVAGTCEDNAARLKERTWALDQRPMAKRMIRVYIDRGYPQNHWAFAAKWEGDTAETVIDNTIGQFNPEVMVFVGSLDAWLAPLGDFLNTKKIRLDPDGAFYMAAFDSELVEEERKAAPVMESGRTAAKASKEARIAETLQKKHSAKKSGKSRRCVIM